MRRRENWIAFKTIVSKEVIRFMRIWMQTILPPAITMSLYFVIFGNFVGSRIGEMGGFTYMQFIAPGLIMMSIITNSYSNVCSSFYSSKFQRSIEEMLVSPAANSVILLGFVMGGILRGLIVGLVVTIVAELFTNLGLHNLFMMVFVAFFSAAIFSLAGFINAVFAKKFDDISIVPTFILTPLIYLGGVFYSVNLLSPVWRDISMANPILYLVSAFRYSLLGVTDTSLWVAFSMIISATIILYVFALWLLKKGIGIRT